MAPYNPSKKRVIEGIPNLIWGGIGDETDDLTVVSALKLCLNHMGEKYSKVYLAGTSCAAFYTGWRAESLGSGMGGSIFLFPDYREPGIANLFKAIGRNYTIVKKTEPELLWKAAVQSINADRPVVCVEWIPVAHRGHFAVLAGYDQEKKEFFGRSYASKAEEEYVSLRPEHLHYILVIGQKSKEKLSSHETALGALRCAVQMSKTGIKAGEEKGAYGLVAYETHARMIPTGIDPKQSVYKLLEHFLFWRLDVLHLCRSYAIQYLKEIANEFSPPSRGHVKAAEECYKQLIGIFDANVQIVFPPESDKLGTGLLWRAHETELPIHELFSTLKGRRRFANLLLKMRDFEQEAIDELDKVVKAEE